MDVSCPRTQVIFDNLELWQYEPPRLAIKKAVVLSWPLPQGQGQFVVESASSLDGPCTTIPDPSSRTNNGQCEVSVRTADAMKFFRLRFAP